ncbi:MAG: hypothetical protein EXR79_07305 [Myxococcales bacterium]|nr:hypothetical protein [Myxococcales bacterium]
MHATNANVRQLPPEEQGVARWQPQPIAAAWHEVLATRSAQRVGPALDATVDVVVRLLAIVALRDYLDGPADPMVEEAIERLDRPQLVDWLDLVAACAAAVAGRGEPSPFAPEWLLWARTPKGNIGPGLAAARRAAAERAHVTAHGGNPDPDDATGGAAADDAGLRATVALLDSMRWFGAYRLVRVVDLTTRRHGGFDGHLQFFVGAEEAPEPVAAGWTGHLLQDVVYLANPTATAFVELSPLVRVLPHPRTRRPALFVLEAAPRLQRLELRHTATGVRVETTIVGPAGEMQLRQWLAARREHGARVANVVLAGPLAVDGDDDAFAPHRQERPRRAIPDLAPQRVRRTRASSSMALPGATHRTRLLVGAQIAVAALLVGATVRLLGPRVRTPTLDPDTVAAAPRKPVGSSEAQIAGDVSTRVSTGVAGAAAPSLPQPVATVRPESIPAAAREPVLPAAPQPRAPAAFALPAAPAASALPATAAAAAAALAPSIDLPPDRAAPPEPSRREASRADAPRAVGDDADAPRAPGHYAGTAPDVLGPEPDHARLAQAAHALRPSYAALQWEQALLLGDASAGDALTAMGRPPATPADPADLARRLHREGSSIIYGGVLKPADRRRLAKDLYADAARRGLRAGLLGVARIALYGEWNRGQCRAFVDAFLAATGPATAAETHEARGLANKCAP